MRAVRSAVLSTLLATGWFHSSLAHAQASPDLQVLGAAFVVPEETVEPAPAVLKFQARVSEARMPLGTATVPVLKVNVLRNGETACTESFQSVRVYDGILNLDIGRGMTCSRAANFSEALRTGAEVAFQVCLGADDAARCLKPVDLGAVPFATKSTYAHHAEEAHRANVAVQCNYAHRVAADPDLYVTQQVGKGYYEFHTPTRLDNLTQDAVTNAGGFIQWTPLQEGDNKLHLCARDGTTGGLKRLATLLLHANETKAVGNLSVGGNTTLSGALSVAGNASIVGNASINGTLGVTGASSLGTLNVSGATGLQGTLDVAGATTLKSLGVTDGTALKTLSVSDSSLLKTLNVSDATMLKTLVVSGTAQLQGGLSVTTVNASAAVTAQSMTLGSTAMSVDALTLNGNATFAGPQGTKVTFSNDVVFTGGITLPANSPVAANSVTTDALRANVVTNAKIADGSVDATKLMNASVTPAKLAEASVTTTKIANGNVTKDKLGTDSVDSSKVADNSLTAFDLAENSVGSSEIQNGAVGSNELAVGSVISSALAKDLALVGVVTIGNSGTAVEKRLSISEDGIYFGQDRWGGNSDRAWIEYKQRVANTEDTALVIGTSNDSEDHVIFQQGNVDRVTLGGGKVELKGAVSFKKNGVDDRVMFDDGMLQLGDSIRVSEERVFFVNVTSGYSEVSVANFERRFCFLTSVASPGPSCSLQTSSDGVFWKIVASGTGQCKFRCVSW